MKGRNFLVRNGMPLYDHYIGQAFIMDNDILNNLTPEQIAAILEENARLKEENKTVKKENSSLKQKNTKKTSKYMTILYFVDVTEKQEILKICQLV